MNININNTENIPKSYAPEKITTSTKQEPISEAKKYAPLSSNPKYYHAMHNISFGSSKNTDEIFYIKGKNGNIFIFDKMPFSDKPFPIKIDSDIVSEYLVDSNDEISPQFLKDFKEIFLSILESDIQSNQAQYKMYSEILEDMNQEIENFYEDCGEDAFDIESMDDNTKEYYEKIIEENKSRTSSVVIGALSEYQGDDDAFAMNVMNNLPKEHKKKLAQILAQFHESRPFDNIRRDAAQKTADIFFLSKTENGYDLSNLDKKKEISNKLRYIKRNWDEETYGMIKEALKDIREKNGKFDPDSISSFIKVVASIDGLPQNSEETYNQIHKFYNIFEKYGTDKSRTADLLIFTTEYFYIEDDKFEEYFSRLFDKEKKEPNEESVQRFIDICKTTGKIVDQIIDGDEEGNTKLVDLDYSIETEKKIINEYYNEFFDFEKWSFKDNVMPTEDFVRNAIEKYL